MNTKYLVKRKWSACTCGRLAKGAGSFLYVDGVEHCSNNYEFTAKAKDYIDNGEYRFKSPVVLYNKAGVVLGLHSVAITNDPTLSILDELKPALLTATITIPETQQQENSMNPLLSLILASLGLAENTTEEQAIAALNQTLQTSKAKQQQKA